MLGAITVFAFMALLTAFGSLFPAFEPVQKDYTYQRTDNSFTSQLMWMGQDDGE